MPHISLYPFIYDIWLKSLKYDMDLFSEISIITGNKWWLIALIWSKGAYGLPKIVGNSIFSELLYFTCTYLHLYFSKSNNYFEIRNRHCKFVILYFQRAFAVYFGQARYHFGILLNSFLSFWPWTFWGPYSAIMAVIFNIGNFPCGGNSSRDWGPCGIVYS